MQFCNRFSCRAAAVLLLHWMITFSGQARAAEESSQPADSTPARRELDPTLNLMRGIIERYTSDWQGLNRSQGVPGSKKRRQRLRRFYRNQLDTLRELTFGELNRDQRIDYLLFQNELDYQLNELERREERRGETAGLIPFAQSIIKLEQARREMQPVEPDQSAEVLTGIREQIQSSQDKLKKVLNSGSDSEDEAAPGKVVANRAAEYIDDLERILERWYEFYAGYHPEFTWWVQRPYREADDSLEAYADFLRKEVVGFEEGEDPPIIGDPIGREAVVEALRHEMIPYSPEALIRIAQKELAWCKKEMRRAARDLGFGKDWRRAMDHVKNLHVEPGEQPQLIRDLAREAVEFIEQRDLLTIPPLSKEIWRMRMMSPERQKVTPYFTGGEVISVSFPTDSMRHEDKRMSMRGNNIHFSRATVHHELIPGHHLQGFMADRYRTHRRIFRTPFLVEGWALYWEMLLWELDFPQSPEDRIGMLFWRSHRCARIIFSLSFHLEKMTAQQAIDFLVDEIGHERRNARAEVRRSVAGNYGPLYQAAYMLGGLQLRALHRELVESGRMTNREFHDAVLRQNSIPIEMIRASLIDQPLSPDYETQWRFYRNNENAASSDSDEDESTADQQVEADPETGPHLDRAHHGTRDDYERAFHWRQRTRDKVFRDRVEPHWFADNKQFWYRIETGEQQWRFIRVNAVEGTREPAFDHRRLARALAESTGEEATPDRLPIVRIRYENNGRTVRIEGELGVWRCPLDSYELTKVKQDDGEQKEESSERERRRRDSPEDGIRSPDGRWAVFVRGHNLFLRNLETKKEHPLTYDGNPGHTYARDGYRRRAMGLRYSAPNPPPHLPEVHWAPDSSRLVALRTRTGTERTVYLVNSAPSDRLQPKLETYPYLKPGDEIPVSTPHLFHVESREEIPIDAELFQNPWSIGDIRWAADSSRFTFVYNQRGHQVLRVISVNAGTGETKAIVNEQSDTFIDYAGKYFIEYLEESRELIWMSERDGWNHLYLYDAQTGEVKHQITQGRWVVRSVEHVDKEKRRIWFRAGGVRPAQDPYYVHYCRVNFDGSQFKVLTRGNGTHSVRFSPDRRFFIDRWSRVDKPAVMVLRRGDTGERICRLEQADVSALRATGWRPPVRFKAKGRDGRTDIYGVIHRPSQYDPDQAYPVIESIYAGPHSAHVPKRFRAYYSQQKLAELGFVVVQIDGMGTSHRSKAFHDVCWKNLGDSGFPDRIRWIQAAADEHPYMDIHKVGIYGGSAGGQSALRGLLAHGDFYRVAVTDCGCHDNRMDKIWWNELWMGWPVGPHYAEQSNVTQAHRLRGDLLLMVGELDKNVDPASTMQVVDALIEAEKDFDMLVFPGAGHGAGGSRYGQRRMMDFFVEHLLGVEPGRWRTES